MQDARIFLPSLDKAREILRQDGWEFKGKYSIHDKIYSSKDKSQGLEKVFLRLRHIPINIWPDKEFVVAIKYTDLQEIGKKSIIPVKQDFDTLAEAEEFIRKNYSDTFEFTYEFDRIGWQNDLNGDQIDLEDIEGHYSIEFKSKTPEGLKKLLMRFDAVDVISGPSVVAVRDLLGR